MSQALHYSIYIEEGGDTAYGVVVPDLPGCFSAGDTLDEAMRGVEEAAAAWIDAMLDAGEPIPPPSSSETARGNPEFEGWALGVLNVDPGTLHITSRADGMSHIQVS